MCERIVSLLNTRNQSCGIDLQKRNFPDRQWCIYAMMELEPSSEIFKASYNPKAARAAHDVEIEPLAGLWKAFAKCRSVAAPSGRASTAPRV